MSPSNTSALPGDILWPHLRELPAFRALVRAIEARLLREQGTLARPLLEISCGDRHYAEVTLGHADVGIDLYPPSLHDAQRRQVL